MLRYQLWVYPYFCCIHGHVRASERIRGIQPGTASRIVKEEKNKNSSEIIRQDVGGVKGRGGGRKRGGGGGIDFQENDIRKRERRDSLQQECKKIKI